MDEYYDPMTITPPTRNDARRLGAMLRRYARGGVLMGAFGMKAGLKPAMKVGFGGERIRPTSVKRLVGSAPTNVRKLNLASEQLRYRPESVVGRRAGAYNGMTEIRPNVFVRDPEATAGMIQETLASESLSELRQNLLRGERPVISGQDTASPTRILMRDAIYGTYNGETRGMLDQRTSNIRRRILSTYNDVKAADNLNATEKQHAFVDELVNNGLLVETQYGTMYADGSYFNPQHTPLEDFLITDGVVSLNDFSINGGLMNNAW